MDTIYLLIPIAMLFLFIALKLFFWAVKNGQFDDLEGPGHSILFDDELDPTKNTLTEEKQSTKKGESQNND